MEHLLRDIRDVAVGTLSTRITSQLQSLQGLHLRLRDIGTYLQKVIDGDLPVNHAILGNLQDVFNLLPNLSTPKAASGAQVNGVKPESVGSDNSELARAMSVKTNDQLMAIYLSSLIRAITAFHDLIENKIKNRELQEERELGGKEKTESKEEEEKEKKVNGVNGEAKDADKGKTKEKENDKKKG